MHLDQDVTKICFAQKKIAQTMVRLRENCFR